MWFQLLHQLGVDLHEDFLRVRVKVQDKFFEDSVLVLTAGVAKGFVVCCLPLLQCDLCVMKNILFGIFF